MRESFITNDLICAANIVRFIIMFLVTIVAISLASTTTTDTNLLHQVLFYTKPNNL